MEFTDISQSAQMNQEWISSTPKHVVLYKAFGWEAPSFAHVGLLQDSQQQKLSKRNVNSAGLDVRGFQVQGILPEALLNFVALYGWSHKRTSDVLNLEQLVQTVRKLSHVLRPSPY